MITEAKGVSQSQGYDSEGIFSAVTKYSVGERGRGRPARDYRLTRLACYLAALSADGTKEQVASAKVYFAVMTREQEELQSLMGLYGGKTEDDIHSYKGLARREEISNWMGAVETMADVLRAVVAVKRMDRQGVNTVRLANLTHYEVGKTVRNWLTSEGIYPEDLPTPTKSYKQIVQEEAARLAREEEDAHGLWGTGTAHLPPRTE